MNSHRKASSSKIETKPKETAQAVGVQPPDGGGITPGERRRMIAEAAYFRAVRRGFGEGSAEQDWYEAEAEIDATLKHPRGGRQR